MVVSLRALLLGGAGRFAENAARCLAKSDIVDDIGVAGRNEDALQHRASEIGQKAHPVRVDILDESHLAGVAAEYDVVVCAAGPEWEVLVPALHASIHAGTHFCDFGAHGGTAWKQLEFDSLAKERGIVAIIGMGYDPGISNLLAVEAVKRFDVVEALRFCYQLSLPDELLKEDVEEMQKSGRIDPSWQLILSNVAGPVRVYRYGAWVVINPSDNGVEVTSPTGSTMTAYPDDNPEQLTIPRFLTGIPKVSCVLAITPPEIDHLVRRETTRIARGQTTVKDATRSFLNTLSRDPGRWLKGSGSGWDMWLEVVGVKDGGRCRYTSWAVRVGGTGIPLAIAALRILRGDVRARGVVGPEACFEPLSFFEEVGMSMPAEDQEKPLFEGRTEWLE